MQGEEIVLIELEDAAGEQAFVAWGVHDKAAFLAAVQERAYWAEHMTPERVRHESLLKTGRGSNIRYVDVVGEPNATALYCD